MCIKESILAMMIPALDILSIKSRIQYIKWQGISSLRVHTQVCLINFESHVTFCRNYL